MSKSNYFENALLLAIFNATAIADLLENDTTSPATLLYLALHTADPGEAGTQATSECAYTGYARKSVARTGVGFTVTADTVVLAANQDFIACSAGTETATHFSIGTAASGATIILYKGTVTPNIAIVNGVTPRLTTGTNIVEA